ncbi:uncharacterized protein LOC124633863 isoform X1 [Helicoverpa zea]|uniref:uncharacterized protein LOC124630891 isoform X1 n=2 Tax=Helicoverpa zea TaxID=7113 RepID=UPI001F5721CE|nr:uncharacterized protein LOC124630891 isoform X1 [Helicoverpa zea]XP_047025188.1 uncharacterized protein LOC124633863 isoform X1 [Helicoverpa zea]XP_049693535.1 uncharacterized protein LOC126054025 isoform X1 [Helicoverpa armigera]XP_049695345.1 uncharacterized protein LOC126054307 [Helicoverpa armigera]XP_049697461.1 uncharacterized protein LOC126054780 isoform X1 [Helicoverpa armigera]XP_049697464.1 uncharacterized protein LOC126054781 isoform X1 [Helicoverpa armigera]XP_049697630.1 uncha
MCARDVYEGSVRGMCVEKDVLRGLRILYQPVHRRSLLEVEVRKIDNNMDNWKKKILLYLTICDEEMEAEDTEFISSIILSNTRTHRFWIRNHIKYHRLHGEFFTFFHTADDEIFENSYRVSRSNFYELHNLIENIIKKEDTHYRECISTKEKLAVCLKYLSTGSSFTRLAENFRIGVASVSRIVAEVCNALWLVLQPLVIPKPTKDDWKRIAKDFQELWQFKNCLGALDGKHVYIMCPANTGSSFFNYKQRFSIVLMCLADARRKIIMVDVGSMGRFSDAGIFDDSVFGKYLKEKRLNLPEPEPLYEGGEPVPFVFIGDEAFPLMENFMRPYPRDQLDQQKRIFNYRLSRARRIVEATFGVLARKWYVYRKDFECRVETVDKIVKATCVMHNFLIERQSNYLDCIDNTNTSTLVSVPSISVVVSSDSYDVREKYCSYFNNQGKVSWQDTRISSRIHRTQ